MKGTQIRKEEVKLSLITDNMVLHVKIHNKHNTFAHTYTLLELFKFSKITGCKIDI